MKYGLFTDLSNEEYHKSNGFLSSSMIKLILQSPELYYQKYIKKSTKEESSDIFDTGTAIHMRILEPDNYVGNVAFFTGTRRGKVWEDFKAINGGKLILGDLQKVQLDKMYASFINSKLGPELISDGNAEVSLFTTLHDTNVKVRADYLNSKKRIIFDLKSTSGIISEDKFKYNLESKLYGYDLQAALYVDAYAEHYAFPEFDFYWIVMSKDFDDIKFFKASKELLEQGRRKYKKALDLIKKYEESNWNFTESIIEVFPSNSFLGDFNEN